MARTVKAEKRPIRIPSPLPTQLPPSRHYPLTEAQVLVARTFHRERIGCRVVR